MVDPLAFQGLSLPPFAVGATLCSGIGAPEVACPEIDWRFAAEIEPFPRAVLQARLGYLPPQDHVQGAPLLWGDMATVGPEVFRAHGLPLPDLLVAGTPCQAFSLAGARAGLADARGNLTLRFVEICHAIQDARSDGRLLVVWENVPGVLSMPDNAFGCLLGGLVGSGSLLPGKDGWGGAGLLAGPRGRAAWRVLDAQFFGVAQRRRRVFVVASLGDGPDPAAILLEPRGRRRSPAPRRAAGQDIAGTLGAGLDRGGSLQDAAAGLLLAFGGNDTRGAIDVSPAILAHGGRCDFASEVQIVSAPVPFDLFNVTAPINRQSRAPGDPCHTLARDNASHAAVVMGPPAGAEWSVRRLTPSEAHVLQGFPADHCAIQVRGKPAADGPQYKALGNSMAVPVMRWILLRALGRPSAPPSLTAARVPA